MNATRARIDALDDAILDLLAERAALVDALWIDKRAAGIAVRDPAREAEIFERVRARALVLGLDPARVEQVFRAVVGSSDR